MRSTRNRHLFRSKRKAIHRARLDHWQSLMEFCAGSQKRASLRVPSGGNEGTTGIYHGYMAMMNGFDEISAFDEYQGGRLQFSCGALCF